MFSQFVTNISEDHAFPVFKIKNVGCSFLQFVVTYQTTRRHVQEVIVTGHRFINAEDLVLRRELLGETNWHAEKGEMA